MKRDPSETDEEWNKRMTARKTVAERRLTISDHMKGFITLEEIKDAAAYWCCSQHTAEQRLSRGELPGYDE